MPKQVDHEQRRADIAAAAGQIVTARGIQGLSFRELADEAGVSVSLVQYYFGTKDQLLVDVLDIRSARLGAIILRRLDDLGPSAGPFARLRAIAESFLPTDATSRQAMLLYLGFAGAALTDPALRRAESFRNGENLVAVMTGELEAAAATGSLEPGVDPPTAALALLSLVLGLATGVLLEQTSPERAVEVLEAHLDLLRSR